MQINRYSNTFGSYNPRTQNTSKTEETLVAPTETKELTEAEEMEIFKKEIYKELRAIDSMAPSHQLSHAVHITDGAFKRMKEEPEYKSKIMDLLRRDTNGSTILPYKTHVTTTIGENISDYSAYGANVYPHDSAETKLEKKSEANRKAEGSFYNSSNYESKFSKNQKTLDKIWLENKKEQDALNRISEERSLLKQSQAEKTLVDKTYLSEHIQGFDNKISYVQKV